MALSEYPGLGQRQRPTCTRPGSLTQAPTPSAKRSAPPADSRRRSPTSQRSSPGSMTPSRSISEHVPICGFAFLSCMYTGIYVCMWMYVYVSVCTSICVKCVTFRYSLIHSHTTIHTMHMIQKVQADTYTYISYHEIQLIHTHTYIQYIQKYTCVQYKHDTHNAYNTIYVTNTHIYRYMHINDVCVFMPL